MKLVYLVSVSVPGLCGLVLANTIDSNTQSRVPSDSKLASLGVRAMAHCVKSGCVRLNLWFMIDS